MLGPWFVPSRLSKRSLHNNAWGGWLRELDTLPRALITTFGRSYPFLPFGLDQFQNPELLLRDIRQRDRQPNALRVENAEAPPDQSAVRRVHRLFEQVLRTVRPVADIDGLPIRAARGAAIQFGLRRISASAATKNAVGAILLSAAHAALVQHRPDQESNARLFRPVAGRGYSGSSSASIASCAMTSDTAADLCTMGTAPA